MSAQDEHKQAEDQDDPHKSRGVNEGVRRLSLVVGLVPLLLCSLMAIVFAYNDEGALAGGFFAAGLVLCGVFWSVVRAVAWIIVGFRRGR
jgi:hypothetical protein